ncbi:PREDICTED: lymphocyte activation gene 3 protein-like [Cyprinodon variegatus]|uniref:Lymphocyte activation gene 3 protein-like n=1 Tax=Cyprinodon variegatus TaxID=28743 RepID=A0A3Q2C6L5_CYPVA|nr:PREDICTED: lymphocyte activation gene 3 protein-like [Cyprinodon variegatus]
MLVEIVLFGGIFLLTTGARCEMTEVTAEAGSQVVLPCKCEIPQCDPAAITWSKDNKGTVWRKQSSGLQYLGSSWFQKGSSRVRCPHSDFVKGKYSLEINDVKVEDGGLYKCKVEFKGRVIEKEIMLRVLQVSFSPSAPMLGDVVSVQCTMSPWPEGAVVNWMVNSIPYEPKNSVIKNQSGRLIKEKALEELAGNWTCFIHKSKNVWKATAQLSFRGIIQPSKDNIKLYAALGSPFTMPCMFSPGISPTWAMVEKLDSEFSPMFKNRSVSTSPSDKSIIIEEVQPENEGKYRCTGIVKTQTLTRSMQLVVAKVVKSKKRGSVMLSCQLSDSSEVTDYEWVHVTYDINGTKSVGSILHGPTITVEDNWGEWTCRYFGKSGLLGNVTTQAYLMAGLSGEKSSAASSNTGTVIGLSFLLVILLLILAQMYKNHQRRKRILQYPALETIVHTISNEREELEKNRVKN